MRRHEPSCTVRQLQAWAWLWWAWLQGLGELAAGQDFGWGSMHPPLGCCPWRRRGGWTGVGPQPSGRAAGGFCCHPGRGAAMSREQSQKPRAIQELDSTNQGWARRGATKGLSYRVGSGLALRRRHESRLGTWCLERQAQQGLRQGKKGSVCLMNQAGTGRSGKTREQR